MAPRAERSKTRALIASIRKLTGRRLMGFAILPKAVGDDTPADEVRFLQENRESELAASEENIKKEQALVALKEDVWRDPVTNLGLTRDQTQEKEEIERIFERTVYEPLVCYTREIWRWCLDGQYEWIGRLEQGRILYDRYILRSILQAWSHKNLVVENFEKYIVSYSIAGTVVTEKATKKSDLDVFVVIDDTDVKKMGRDELLSKLKNNILGLAADTGHRTKLGVHLNVQTYILTEYWLNLKNGNPIIFTLLRDGVPLYDRGIFGAWKVLLLENRIRPSQEQISQLRGMGDGLIGSVRKKIQNCVTEDLYYAMLAPTQAALMVLGYNPTTPSETIDLLNQELTSGNLPGVKRQDASHLKNLVELRKSFEHNGAQNISREDLFSWLEKAERYVKKITRAISAIELSELKRDIREVVFECVRLRYEVRGESKLDQATFERLADGSLPSWWNSEPESDGELLKLLDRLKNLQTTRSSRRLRMLYARASSMLRRSQRLYFQ